MNKNKKIIIGTIIAILIIVGITAVAYKIIGNNMVDKAKPKFPVENNPSNEVSQKQNQQINQNDQKYSKVIDNIKIELNIPNNWNYEETPRDEENDFYKYALKLYKNDKEQYAMLYFYNNKFGVCGTGRTSEKITLNNGKEAMIGYYDEKENWSDISFYNINEYIAVMNYELTSTDAKEVIEIIKTINITEE